MISEYPTQPASRRRSLVGDLCKGVTQSMGFWGCDARHPAGNLLVASGFERLEKNPALTEGSSRYRKPWLAPQEGVSWLESFLRHPHHTPRARDWAMRKIL